MRRHLRSTTAPQFALPLATVEAELARAEGKLDEARASVERASVERALVRTTPGEEPRYRWPLLSLGARIEAERAIRASDHGGPVPEDALERSAVLLAQAEELDAGSPRCPRASGPGEGGARGA